MPLLKTANNIMKSRIQYSIDEIMLFFYEENINFEHLVTYFLVEKVGGVINRGMLHVCLRMASSLQPVLIIRVLYFQDTDKARKALHGKFALSKRLVVKNATLERKVSHNFNTFKRLI